MRAACGIGAGCTGRRGSKLGVDQLRAGGITRRAGLGLLNTFHSLAVRLEHEPLVLVVADAEPARRLGVMSALTWIGSVSASSSRGQAEAAPSHGTALQDDRRAARELLVDLAGVGDIADGAQPDAPDLVAAGSSCLPP